MIVHPMRRCPASAQAAANRPGPYTLATFDVLSDPSLPDTERDEALDAMLSDLTRSLRDFFG
jgi:hypothetical protein